MGKGKVKAKTHKGAAKRFKVTGTGKVMRNTQGKRHLLEHKSPARKRRLAGAREVSASDMKRVKNMLPHR